MPILTDSYNPILQSDGTYAIIFDMEQGTTSKIVGTKEEMSKLLDAFLFGVEEGYRVSQKDIREALQPAIYDINHTSMDDISRTY